MTGNRPGLTVRDGEGRISIQAVDGLIDRVQRLVDRRTAFAEPVAWQVEGALLGDLPAIAALATIAARPPATGTRSAG